MKVAEEGHRHGFGVRRMSSNPDRTANPDGGADGRAAELVFRIRAGEPDAVQQVRRRVRKILGFKGLRVPDDQRDDLEQEVVTQVWQAVNRPRFDPDGGFWGFVELVTSRRCIDWLRSRKPSSPLNESLEDRGPGPLGRTLSQERTKLALSVLESLDPSCRELISLRVGEGLSYRELATRLGKSEGALRVQMFRCVQRSRELLGAEEPER